MSTATFDETAHPRHATGQFATKTNDAPSGALTATEPVPASVFGPINATIVLQELDHWDRDFEIGTTEADLGAVLDGLHIDDLPESADDYEKVDGLFLWAKNMGIAPEHDGPFEIVIDDDELESYRAARERAGRRAAVTKLPTATPAERKEKFNSTLLEQLPAGGISEVMAWDHADAARWVGTARVALVQQVAQGAVQVEFLDEDDRRMFTEINEASTAAYETHRDTEKVRDTALHLYEHLARTQW